MRKPIFSPFSARGLALIILSMQVCGIKTALGASVENSKPGAEAKVAAFNEAKHEARHEAKEVLSKAIAFQREAQDLVLKFRASVYNSALDKQEEYTGKLWLKGAEKFKLEIPGGTYLSDGITYTEYHAQNHQAVLRNAKDSEDKPLPGEMLLRFLDSEPIGLAKAKVAGKEFLELRLDPSQAMKNLDSLVVLLDKGTYALHRITSRDVAGNEAQYTILSVKRNGGIRDKEFAFTAPKGSELIDMRE